MVEVMWFRRITSAAQIRDHALPIRNGKIGELSLCERVDYDSEIDDQIHSVEATMKCRICLRLMK